MTERRGRRFVINAGSCEIDLTGLWRLAEAYDELMNTLNYFLSDFMQQRGNLLLAKTKNVTPVGKYHKDVAFYARTKNDRLKLVELWGAGEGLMGGTLQRSWRCSDVRQTGQEFKVTVYSQLSYAPYVEYGHRTVAFNSKGRIVGWWEGHHMAKNSLEEVQRGFKNAFEIEFLDYLHGLGIGTDGGP